MAKKAKHKLAEDEKFEAFQFPDFDERKFLDHEYEQSIATAIAVLLAIALAAICWELDRLMGSTQGFLEVPWIVGLAGVVAGPFLIRSLRPLADDYTKGDWAWLILTTFMGWLGVWFLLADLIH
jgi:hypothetical protein